MVSSIVVDAVVVSVVRDSAVVSPIVGDSVVVVSVVAGSAVVSPIVVDAYIPTADRQTDRQAYSQTYTD